MKKFKLNPLAAMMSSLVLAAGTQMVYAQDADTESASQDEEEVVVQGFRRSILNAIDTKRNADSIVEAISADDIGGLPDVSIADALGRVPGITVNRTGGSASTISIRGLSPDYVFATLNGREQVSPNRGRRVEFNQYPAELLSEVQVYKTPKASLIEGGVGGTIELKTVNPLDMDVDQKFHVGLRGSYNDLAGDITGAEEFGSRFSVSYMGKYLDDTLGFAAGYARLQQGNVEQRYEGKNWNAFVDNNGNDIGISDGFEFGHKGGEETRDGYMATLEYRPTDKLSVQADYYLSKFENDTFDKGFLWQNLGNFEIDNRVLAANGVDVVGGQASLNTASNPSGANDTRANGPLTHVGSINSRNQGFQTVSSDKTEEDEVESMGLNVKWEEESWEVAFDWSRSEAEGFYNDGLSRAHLYDPNQRTAAYQLDPTQGTATPLLDDDGNPTQRTDSDGNLLWNYGRPSSMTVAWLNQQGSLPRLSTPQDFTNLDAGNGPIMRLTTYEKYPHLNTDEIDAIKLDGTIRFDDFFISSVDIGARYSDRHYIRSRQTFVYDSTDGANGNNLLSTSLEIRPEDVDVVNFTDDYSHFPSFLDIDSEAVFARAVEQGLVVNNDGTLRDTSPRARWGEGRSWSNIQRADVTEEVFAYYLQANIETEIAGMPLAGNIGVRVVDTDQSAIGIQPSDPQLDIGDDAIRDDLGRLPEDEGLTTYGFIEDGIDYTKNLPSINLSLSITDNDIIRFAAATVITRADIDELANDVSSQLNLAQNNTVLEFSQNATNNPRILPFEADQIDLSYEHYFEETEGYFAVAIYNKDIVNQAQTFTFEDFDFTSNGIERPVNYTLPAARNPDGSLTDTGASFPVVDGDLTVTVNNADGGYIRGMELSYSQTYTFLPEPFDTLGLNANYSYVESEIEIASPFATGSGGTLPFPGLAENSGSATLFWDYKGFETRLTANYTDEKVDEVLDPTGATGGNLQIFEETITAAFQASYAFDNGVNVLFQINNLTDEPVKSYWGEESNTANIKYFGRQYYVGFNYTFE